MTRIEKIAHFLVISCFAAFCSAASSSTPGPSVSQPETQTPGNHSTGDSVSTAQVLEACGDREDCFSKVTDTKLTDQTNPGQSRQEKAARDAALILHGSYTATPTQDGTNK